MNRPEPVALVLAIPDKGVDAMATSLFPIDHYEDIPFTPMMRPSWAGASAPSPTIRVPAREPAATLAFGINDVIRWLPQASRSERIALAQYLAELAR